VRGNRGSSIPPASACVGLAFVACVAIVACFAMPSRDAPAPVRAGAAGMVAVFDQLAARGVLDDVQHATLIDGVRGMDSAVKAAPSSSVVVLLSAVTAAAVVVAVHVLTGLQRRRLPSSEGSP
jgi:hypothetical protein